MQKADVRKLIANRKRQHTEVELRVLSLAAVSNLLANPRLQAANTILLYYSMRGEVDTHELVERLYQEGKTVLLPRVTGEHEMALVKYTGKDCLKPAGGFHILEPQGEPVPLELYNNVQVAVIPGIAFTVDGKRLGRGGGYYDNILKLLGKTYKIGLAFQFQILGDIPTDNLDMRVDEVVW